MHNIIEAHSRDWNLPSISPQDFTPWYSLDCVDKLKWTNNQLLLKIQEKGYIYMHIYICKYINIV